MNSPLRSLPILLYEERRLTPALGYVFDQALVNPGESLLSMLWKFARLNTVSGAMLFTEIAANSVDPYEGLNFRLPDLNVPRLGEILGVSKSSLHFALATWTSAHRLSSALRWCPSCMHIGYHSIVHQFHCVQRCPIHLQWIEHTCRHCRSASAYQLHASVLDAPFRCMHCRRPFQAFEPPRFSRRLRHERMESLWEIQETVFHQK